MHDSEECLTAGQCRAARERADFDYQLGVRIQHDSSTVVQSHCPGLAAARNVADRHTTPPAIKVLPPRDRQRNRRDCRKYGECVPPREVKAIQLHWDTRTSVYSSFRASTTAGDHEVSSSNEPVVKFLRSTRLPRFGASVPFVTSLTVKPSTTCRK